MKFLNLEIHNFLSIGEASISLDALGLVHVSGTNHDETSADSNGSGKSSVSDAIHWCLWGSTARDVSADEVVNQVAGKNCSVQLTIDDDGEQYRVIRYRKHSKGKNALRLYKLNDAGEWDDLTKGTNPMTQRAVERLMGCSEEVFAASVVSGQEAMPDIPRMTDKQLKTLVEQAAGVNVLTDAYEVAKQKLSVAKSERATAQVENDLALTRVDSAQASLARLQSAKTDWDAQNADDIDALKQRARQAVDAYRQSHAALDPSVAEQIRADIAEAQARTNAVQSERDRERTLQGDVDTARQALNGAQQRVTRADAQLEQFTAAAGKLDQREKATTGAIGRPCGTCGEPMNAKHVAAALDKITTERAQLAEAQVTATADRKKAETAVRAAEKMLQDANQALAQHRASMTDVSAETAQIAALNGSLRAEAMKEAEVKRLHTQATAIAGQLKTATERKNPVLVQIAAQEDELDRLRTAHSDAGTVLAEKYEVEQYAQAVADVFAPSGVRAHRLDEATPYLNDRTAHYLGSLADGAIEAFWTTLVEKKSAKGALAERFSVTVEKAGTAPSFNALSGGEKRKVRLACALALQDLVATRATKSIELWVGDEIDDALDDPGLERLMGVLEQKARDRGTVLVISHNDIAAFTRRQIEVVKKGGVATVTMN